MAERAESIDSVDLPLVRICVVGSIVKLRTQFESIERGFSLGWIASLVRRSSVGERSGNATGITATVQNCHNTNLLTVDLIVHSIRKSPGQHAMRPEHDLMAASDRFKIGQVREYGIRELLTEPTPLPFVEPCCLD